MSNKILLVEDEENLAKAILLNLELEGYQLTWIKNGNLASAELQARPTFYDLIILDVMIPEKDGFSLCKEFRAINHQTPILFLSARNSAADKIIGLKAGANDYMGKPFNLEEFLLRVNILLNTLPSPSTETEAEITIGKNVINTSSFSMQNRHGQETSLSKFEMDLLTLLFRRKGKTLSREEIINQIGNGRNLNGRTIDNTVSRLRKLMELDPKSPKFIISVRGVGYRLNA